MAPSPHPPKLAPARASASSRAESSMRSSAVRSCPAVTDGAGQAVILLLAAAACVGRPLPAAPDGDGSVDASIVDPAAFVAVPPCPTEADYATGTATVTFGFFGSPPGFVYEPSCLAIAAG